MNLVSPAVTIGPGCRAVVAKQVDVCGLLWQMFWGLRASLRGAQAEAERLQKIVDRHVKELQRQSKLCSEVSCIRVADASSESFGKRSAWPPLVGPDRRASVIFAHHIVEKEVCYTAAEAVVSPLKFKCRNSKFRTCCHTTATQCHPTFSRQVYVRQTVDSGLGSCVVGSR